MPDQKSRMLIILCVFCSTASHSLEFLQHCSQIMELILHNTKFCTTAYHPPGDGMVERFNRTAFRIIPCYHVGVHDVSSLLY